MRILADENFPRLAVDALREQGHDVLWIHSDFPGWSDSRILQHAQQERRLNVTLDSDFGELAFRFGLSASCGVIFFRLRGSSPELTTRRLLKILQSRSGWSGVFAVVEEDRIESDLCRASNRRGGSYGDSGSYERRLDRINMITLAFFSSTLELTPPHPDS